MKNPLRPFVTILATAFILSAAYAGAKVDYATDASPGLRHRLVAAQWVEALYAIDDHLTYFTVEAGRDKPEGGLASFEGVAPTGGYTLVYSRVDNNRKHYIIRHDRPEPLIYKSRTLADPAGGPSGPGGLKTPEAGEYALTGDGYSTADFYQHAIAACRKDAGTPLFLIPRSNGRHKRLTKVDALSAFRYILSTGGSEDTVWYIACEGDRRFVVEKNYRSLTGGVDLATVILDRGLEGVNYAENWGLPEEPAKGPLSTVVAVVTGRGGRANEPTKKFLKQMAREVAFVGGNLMRVNGQSRYSGFYSESPSAPGCAEVSINHVLYSPEKNQTRIKVYDFRVCDSKVKSTGTSEETAPGKIDLFARFFKWRPF
jgi:hypothetical protein